MHEHRWLAMVCLVLASAWLPLTAFGQLERVVGQPDELKIAADAIQHDRDTGQAIARGNVKIDYGKLTLTADEASVNQFTSDFTASGNVVITTTEGASWRTPAVKGNLETKALQFGPYRLDSEVWHSGGAGGSNDESERKVLENAWLSTCDREHPHYRLSAARIVHSADGSFVARHVVVKFGSVPVLYFPILWGSTDERRSLMIKPGYSSRRGAYLEISRFWAIADLGTSKIQLDLMSKRGVGLGNTTHLETESQALDVNVYGVLDSDPPETDPGFNRRFKETHDRYRLHSYYQNRLTDDLALRLNIDFLSDIDMLEDWFRRDFRRLQQPRSYLDLSYDQQHYSLGLAVRPRLNDFYTTVETLPELRLDVPRLALGELPLQYQSSTTAGYYSMKWRNFDRPRWDVIDPLIYDSELHRDPGDYQSWRGDTLHFLYLPLALEDRISLTPRAGFRATYYSKTSKRRITESDLADILEADNPDWTKNASPVVSYDTDGGDRTRMAFEVGAELRTKFFRDWGETTADGLALSRYRHVLEPYVNYTYAPEPTVDREHLLFFDETDRLTRQHFVRFGLDQRLLTCQERQQRTLLRLQSYADLHFDRGEESGRHGGDLGNRLDFTPRDDLRAWVTVVHDMGEGHIQRAETGIGFGREDAVNFGIRYLYRNDHLSRSVWSMGSTLVDLSGESSYLKKRFESADIVAGHIIVPVNPLTKLVAKAEYDLEQNTLSEHSYELHRQLHCWVMALGVGWDNGEFQAMIMFHLTAFPKVKIDLNL
ncbi:MAG: LPS-assembly protein LptD [Lentisphaerae bacterium]|nr:LPS-assembly protein LptD [Lentisphaerota bacterium]